MDQNRTALNRAVAAWNRGDLEDYLTLYDATIRLHGYSPEPLDKAAVTGFYRMIFATFPAEGAAGPLLDFHEVLEDGDRMAIRFTMTGVHRGHFMGVPATGRSITLPGITVLHFRAAKVVERWSSADMLGLMMQIGAIPPPGG